MSLYNFMGDLIDMASNLTPCQKYAYMAQLRAWNKSTYVYHHTYTFVLTLGKGVNPKVLYF
jgi:hypothetical protein